MLTECVKLINTEIKLHCNPGCESYNVEKQLQATTTNQTAVYVQLTTASTSSSRNILISLTATSSAHVERMGYEKSLFYTNILLYL